MFRIIGADGKEYGPVTAEQVRHWLAEGRLNAQSRVKEEGSTDWKMAASFPEFGSAIPSTVTATLPPPISPGQSGPREQGMAIASLVLGLLSFLCFGFLTGVPAIICGHLARGRAQRSPARFGGAGLALAGLILGYVGTLVTLLVLPAMLLPALSKAKARAQSINCVNNMKQVGLAFRIWSTDNQRQFPFNVSTNAGGTLEFCQLGPDGFDQNAVMHFQVISNELATPKILVCVADSSKTSAVDFRNLTSANVSYRLYTGTNLSEANPTAVLAVCPIHGHILYCDGSVKSGKLGRKANAPPL